MASFYKIVNNQAQVGSGIAPDNTWIEYEVGKEPEELVEALESERVNNELANKIAEAKAYLASTDYKMTIDYFATLSKEVQDELIVKRDEAREFVRSNQ